MKGAAVGDGTEKKNAGSFIGHYLWLILLIVSLLRVLTFAMVCAITESIIKMARETTYVVSPLLHYY